MLSWFKRKASKFGEFVGAIVEALTVVHSFELVALFEGAEVQRYTFEGRSNESICHSLLTIKYGDRLVVTDPGPNECLIAGNVVKRVHLLHHNFGSDKTWYSKHHYIEVNCSYDPRIASGRRSVNWRYI